VCTPPGASLECTATASATVTSAGEALDAAVDLADSSPLDATPPPLDSTVASLDASLASLDASLDASAITGDASGTVAVAANLQALIGTVKTHMPAIILLVNTQANLYLDATNEVTSTGTTVVDNVTSEGGKSLACATTAVSADVSASASMSISVQASSNVSGACGGPTSS
jgi:hypothetical protein